MADSPSDEWTNTYPRVKKSRAKSTFLPGEPRGGHKTVTGTDRYRTPDPVGHRLTKDPKAKKVAKGKAVSGAKAENKALDEDAEDKK